MNDLQTNGDKQPIVDSRTIIDMDDRCEINTVHEQEVARSKLKMPDESILCELGDFFKTLGDSTRIKIVSALMTGELCVCDIAATVDMTVSAVSHQLRVLRQAKIVRTRRDGKQIFYSIEDNHVGILFTMGLEHVREAK